mgnify:CR=1 FL=1
MPSLKDMREKAKEAGLMKLDENDRGNTTRLMKTKEMLANRE